MPSRLKTRFVYSRPFNITDENRFFKLNLFNMNTHRLDKRKVFLKNVLKGAEIEHRGMALSLYAKQRLEPSHKGTQNKLTLRLIGKDFLIPGMGVDSKVSIDWKARFSHRSLVYWDEMSNFTLKGIPFFISNTTVMGISSSCDINPAKIQRIYIFGTKPQNWNRTISSYNRIGVVNKTGFLHFSAYLFGNLQAYRKPEGFDWNWSVGLGSRLLLSNNFALEGLFNLTADRQEQLISTKFLYLD